MKTTLHFHGNGRAYEPLFIVIEGAVTVQTGSISDVHDRVIAEADVQDFWHVIANGLSFPAVTITTEGN